MKNRQGSVLALVLMIFSIVMIFGTVSISLAMNESGQSIRHENKTKAYYIARSGAEVVEAALLQMSKEEKDLVNQLANASDGDKPSIQLQLDEIRNEIRKLNEEINKGPIVVDELDINRNTVNVTIVKESGNSIVIKAKAKVGNVEETVIKVMGVEEKREEKNGKIDKVIFASGDINIKEGTITGDISSNNNIKITGWPTITGDAYLLKDNRIISENSEWLKQQWDDTKTKNMESAKTYTSAKFLNYFEKTEGSTSIPEFIKFSNYPIGLGLSPDLEFYWDRMEFTINSDKRYNKIKMVYNSILTIDTSDSDINIWTKELADVYQIKVIGNNKVNIHIDSNFSTNSNISPIVAHDLSKINIYFSGEGSRFSTNNSEGTINTNLYLKPRSENITINNSQLKGNIYVYKGSLSTSGGGLEPRIKGNIYIKQGNIDLPNGDVEGDIYLYNGNLNKLDSGTIIGNIFIESGSLKIGGSGGVNGSILSGGSYISLDGGSSVYNALIYAPNADISMIAGAKLEGALIGKTITMDGGANITFKPEYINLDLIGNINASTYENIIKFTPGYYR